MKKVSLLIAAFALVLGFSQCRKPNLPALNGETQHVVLNASWDNGGSKIEQDGSLLKWTEGDKLTVTGGATGELSCTDAADGTFEGTITKTTGEVITFTFQGANYKENFKEQTGVLNDAIKLLSDPVEYKPNGDYGEVEMKMSGAAVLKLDLSYFAPSPSKADVTVNISVKAEAESKEEDVIASVKCASDKLGEVYVAVPAKETPATYTFSDGSGKTVDMPWPALYGNTFFTAGGNGGAEVIEPAAPTTPKFTVADGTTVEFAPGNLYWDGSSWQFEANQWDFRTYAGKNSCIGGSVTTDGTPSGHWGLFGWSTSSTTYGMSTSKDNNDYSGDFVDWGTASGLPSAGEGKTWRTLSQTEWDYLLNTRDNASDLHAWMELDGGTHNGLVILPDGTEASVMSSITTTEALATHGAVFLPAAGYRNGTGVDDVGSSGTYWSSSCSDSDGACDMYFDSGSVDPYYNDLRFFGLSVRLVR